MNSYFNIIYNYTFFPTRSGVAEVNSGRIASLECKIIACLWFLT